ncbi:nucleosome-remodeling factor subunit BPTF-like isoform X2 [Stegodyphus dumicola]|uniref:nucleosome-remodeling factor subunit BPTF-like isoform X2 n=1 Tax=Stegodyphus dumicola TaxID=202533 RepID=UPI0015B0BBF9|nr:nucleosome-remodeling factor subunit BPTF-like isoform X2 [Stegodyphus dumicola]
MDITEKLTNSAKGNKKSYLEVENAALAKIQSERAIQKAKEAEERLREAEREAAMLGNVSSDSGNPLDGSLWSNTSSINMNQVDDRPDAPVKIDSTDNKVESCPPDSKPDTDTKPENIQDLENNNEVKIKQETDSMDVNSEVVSDENSKSNEAVGSIDGGEGNSDLNEESSNEGNEAANNDNSKKETSENEKLDETDSKKGVNLKIFAKGGKGNFIRLEKKEDDDTDSQKGGIVTRSKTGALTPRNFSFENFVKTTTRKNGEESIIIVSKDGEITRMTTRSKSNASNSSTPTLFKLGMESSGKNYMNQFAINTLALNKHQHAEDRDKRRHLSHKFSLTPASEFKWQGTTHGDRGFTVATLRQAVLQLENNIPAYLLHAYWTIHRSNWLKAVNKCTFPKEFALALSILEAVMKPVLFTSVWNDSLGKHH